MKLEKNLMARIGGTLLMACALVTVSATRADATLLVAIDINGNQFCVADNNVGCTFGFALTDTDGLVGTIRIADQTLAGLGIQGSVQQATLGPPLNILNTSSLQLTNTSSGTLTATLAVGATGFTAPATIASGSGSATWQTAAGSSIEMGWYNDPNNEQGAETPSDTPGSLLGGTTLFDSITGVLSDSTSFLTGDVAVDDPNPFSMTLWTQMVLTSGATVVNNGQTELKPVGVPEPASMALFGLGLLGAGAAARRRRKASL